MEGYSGTPLAKKLGIKEGFTVLLVNEPVHYKKLFTDFPLDVKEVHKPKTETVDFIHVFLKEESELKCLLKLKDLLKKNGLLWISWPKGTSKIQTNINRDLIRNYVLEKIGLVDIKVAAIDADWSGLKFVFRKEDR